MLVACTKYVSLIPVHAHSSFPNTRYIGRNEVGRNAKVFYSILSSQSKLTTLQDCNVVSCFNETGVEHAPTGTPRLWLLLPTWEAWLPDWSIAF